MDISSGRIPSRQESMYGFAICAFPVYVWAIFAILQEIPAWILRLSIVQLIGVISYTLLFALLEASAVFFVLWLLAVLLPQQWYRQRFIAHTFMIMLVASIWMVVLHYNSDWISQRNVLMLGLWFGSFLATQALGYIAVIRSQRLQILTNEITERLSVLSYLYAFLSVVGIVTVLLRNL